MSDSEPEPDFFDSDFRENQFRVPSDEEEIEPFLMGTTTPRSRTCPRLFKFRRCVLLLVFLLIVAVLVISMLLILTPTKESPSSAYGYYSRAAVASDSKQCSEIGRDVLKENGSAVDAAIATLFCIGVHNAQSAGIGGGFFMVVHSMETGQSWALDARETAPSSATPQIYINKSTPFTGSLSIGVPGEIRGYHEAWLKFGRLPWKRLVQPTINMCRQGYIVEEALAKAIQEASVLMHANDGFRKIFVKPDSTLYQEGDIMSRPKLGNTLERIAENPEAFYNGFLADDILADLKEIGANITAADLSNYTSNVYDALRVELKNGDVIHTLKPPSSGVLLAFMLRVLEGFKLTESDFRSDATYQKIVETFKFSYALRTYLGDENFVNVAQIMKNLTSSDFADYIRSHINLSYTQPPEYYNPAYLLPPKNRGTSHLSIIGSDGLSVSVTSTINSRFGSERVGSRTEIIFNDEMNDFTFSNDSSFRPANLVSPGKRPMSSMCPAVVVNKDGHITMVIGAAGSSYITTATAFVATHAMWLGLDMKEAVDELRLHHQFQPNVVRFETNFPEEPLQALRRKGHDVDPGKYAVVQAIHSTCRQTSSSVSAGDDCILAVSDWRKGGEPSGF